MRYWSDRQHLKYYELVREWMGSGESVADIGSRDTPVATWGRFDRRYAVDLRLMPDLPNVECVQADFMTWAPPERLSLVTCLQVLEHVEDPSAFLRRCLSMATRVIVSVPYRWPKGREKHHLHDPVSENDVERWAGRQPWQSAVVRDRFRRLVCEF